MPGTNDFLAFGTAGGANVLSETAYAALAARPGGFVAGTANSVELNKVWRQSSTMAAVLGQIIANSGANAVDDGNVALLVSQLITAIGSALASTQIPIGSVVAWPASTTAIPANWLECNGSPQSRTGATAALFGVVSTAYGNGDGTGLTFSLPDYRGEFLRGLDHGRGADPGRGITSFQDWSTGAPKTTSATHQSVEAGTSALVAASNPSMIGFVRAAKGGESVTTTGVDSAEPVPGEVDLINVTAGDAETRPRNRAVIYIIRYQ